MPFCYERERRSIDHRMRLSSGGMPLEESGLERSASGGAWLPKAQFIVHWSPDMMTYVSVVRGYRGAGFNPGALDQSDLGFKAEYSWTYELGAKTSWWNDRLILNAATFVIEIVSPLAFRKDLIRVSINSPPLMPELSGMGEFLPIK